MTETNDEQQQVNETVIKEEEYMSDLVEDMMELANLINSN